jgi:hypothetical protein
MIWIFASVVLFLAIEHEGFRKVLLWVGGTALTILLLCVFAVIR